MPHQHQPPPSPAAIGTDETAVAAAIIAALTAPADVISIADIRHRVERGEREAPLSRQELRALRQLAAVAPQLLHLLASADVGRQMCPTWRRVQDETARRACDG